MKKLIRGLFVVFALVLVFTSFKVKANTPPVESIDGASIRNKSGETVKQGLRFYAKLDETVKENEHGFYVIFGESDIGELITALEFDPLEINGKKVHRVVVDGVALDNEFRVVLTGIPGKGYLDNITVIPFVVVDEAEVYDNAVTRSIGEVALKAANANEATGDVIPYLEENYKRVVFTNEGKILFTGNMLETNHFQLREEFIKDWNTKFGTTWIELVASTFHTNATIGAVSNDLVNSNLYKFFNDSIYKDKWGFILDVAIAKDAGIVHVAKQANAVKGEGFVLKNDEKEALYGANHLNYSIANFFNQKHDSGGYNSVNFTNLSSYDSILNLLTSIYINYNKYEFFKIGEEIGVGHPGERDGYIFKHFLDGETIYMVGDDYAVLADDLLLTLIYEAIEYDVEFYLGETKLEDLSRKYTIEDEVVLIPFAEEGYAFNGWFDNPELQGAPVTSIPLGSIGDKKFYADATQSEYVKVDVTYKLNGGTLGNYEELVDNRDSTLIVATRYSATGDTTGKPITVGTGSGGLYWYVMGFKPTNVDKVYELVGKGTNYTNPEAVIYVSYHTSIDSPYKAALQSLYNSITAGHLLVIPWLPEGVMAETSVDMFFMAQGALTDDLTFELQDPEAMPITTVKEGHEFVGWFTDVELEDGPVESYPGYKPIDEVTKVTYYAKWEEIVLTEKVAYILDVGYTSINDAIVSASPGDTIILVEGDHDVPFTVNKNNLTFVPELGKTAVIKAKITVGANMVGLKFEGLEFTGGAFIHAPAKLDGFVFIDNYVYDLTLVGSDFLPANRVDVTAFIRIYTEAGTNQTGDVLIQNNEFKNINADIISIDRTTLDKTIDIKNNIFHNFALSAIRFDGGYNNGTYNITGNTFKHDTKGANKSVILFRAYAPEDGNKQIINILNNEFINVGNTSVGYNTSNGQPGSGVILFGTFNDRLTEVNINNNAFKGTANAIHFRNAGAVADLSADMKNNTFEDNDGYYLHQVRPATHPAPEADFTGNIFKDANGEVITNLAILQAKIINNNTYDKPAQPTFNVNYDFGEYGYMSEDTKLDLFEDFATDWKAAFARGNSVEVIMGNFFGDGLPAEAVMSSITDYEDGKWQWLFDYIIDVANEKDYANKADLIAYSTSWWRSNLHAFWNDGVKAGWPASMDLTGDDATNNGFWRASPYNKAEVLFESELVIIDGSTVNSWNDDYEFEGWYSDVELTVKVTELPESLEDNLTLYAKWVAK